MNVQALKPGFIHNHYKNEGDEFAVTEKEFSHKWMVCLDEPTAVKPLPVKKEHARKPIAPSKVKAESVLPAGEVI